MLSISIPSKARFLKASIKELLPKKDLISKIHEHNIAKAASKASSLSNKPVQEIAKDIAIEAKPISPEIPKAVIESDDVSPDFKSEVLETLKRVEHSIISDKDEGFRRNVLKKLKSIDNKIQRGTLAYQGSFLI